MSTLCHCGQPLHYSNPDIQRYVEKLSAENGEFVDVQVGNQTWRVQRHYIALHGLRAADIHTLGFKLVKR